jgi:hypothetical protein
VSLLFEGPGIHAFGQSGDCAATREAGGTGGGVQGGLEGVRGGVQCLLSGSAGVLVTRRNGEEALAKIREYLEARDAMLMDQETGEVQVLV